MSNSFYEVIVALISKPHKDPMNEERYKSFFLVNKDAAFSVKILAKWMQGWELLMGTGRDKDCEGGNMGKDRSN